MVWLLCELCAELVAIAMSAQRCSIEVFAVFDASGIPWQAINGVAIACPHNTKSATKRSNLEDFLRVIITGNLLWCEMNYRQVSTTKIGGSIIWRTERLTYAD